MLGLFQAVEILAESEVLAMLSAGIHGSVIDVDDTSGQGLVLIPTLLLKTFRKWMSNAAPSSNISSSDSVILLSFSKSSRSNKSVQVF